MLSFPGVSHSVTYLLRRNGRHWFRRGMANMRWYHAMSSANIVSYRNELGNKSSRQPTSEWGGNKMHKHKWKWIKWSLSFCSNEQTFLYENFIILNENMVIFFVFLPKTDISAEMIRIQIRMRMRKISNLHSPKHVNIMSYNICDYLVKLLMMCIE